MVGPLACIAVAAAIALADSAASRTQVIVLALISFGAVAAGTAVRRMQLTVAGRRRRAWFTVSVGLCLGVAANVLGLVLNAVQALEWLGLVDALLIAALIACVVALTLFPPTPRRGTDLTRLIMDGVVVGGSVLFIASVTIFPRLLAGDIAPADQLHVLALPVLDIVIATLATLLIARSGITSKTPLRLLGAAFLLYAISDTAYAVNVSVDAYALGSWWDLGWLGGYVLVWLAALHHDAGQQAEEAPTESSALWSTIVCLTLFLVAAVISNVVAARGGLELATRIMWGLVILTVVIRQIVLGVDNEQLRFSLESRVLERTKELREITAQRELLLGSVADGIYGVNRDGQITMVNAATIKLLARSERDLLGANAHELFHASQQDGTVYPVEGCYITEATRSGLTASAEDDVYLRGDGERIDVEATASPLQDDTGISGAVVVFRDVSQRREMDRMKQEFISVVSHELRTPLTSIRGALGLLAGGAFGELPPKAAKMIDVATAGSVRLGRLVNDILDIERLDSGMLPLTIRSHEAAAACREAVAATSGMAQAANIALTLGPTTGVVRADRERLVQVLINLIGNALRFSDPGGLVVVSATPIEDRIGFAVSDRGRGIPADRLEAIFGRFSQVDSSDSRERGGTGLGLSICRGLIARMGGRIWAESTLGEGSTFRFELIADGETAQPRSAPASAVAADPRATR